MVGAKMQAAKSDLGTRAVSAVVMLAVAGTALWFGGILWLVFVAAIALGVFWEWRNLVAGFEKSPANRGLWNAAGIVYIGIAALVLARLRQIDDGFVAVLQLVLVVIATDIGAYFAGRTFGGPKIAPKISPSKTWSGLIGGALLAALVMAAMVPWTLFDFSSDRWLELAALPALGGAIAAVVAQAGDFFESWMKRRAGVKDSGRLIPGHGGLFDRVDGLLAVLFVAAFLLAGTLFGGN